MFLASNWVGRREKPKTVPHMSIHSLSLSLSLSQCTQHIDVLSARVDVFGAQISWNHHSVYFGVSVCFHSRCGRVCSGKWFMHFNPGTDMKLRCGQFTHFSPANMYIQCVLAHKWVPSNTSRLVEKLTVPYFHTWTFESDMYNIALLKVTVPIDIV